MKVKRSKRLAPVARYATSREQQAATRLADSRRLCQARETRLEELIGYRAQYARDFHVAGSAGLQAGAMRDYQVFMTKLDAIIKSQRSLVAEAWREHERNKQVWQRLHGKAKALDNAVARCRGEERRRAEAREQNEADERSQHRHPGSRIA